MCILPYSAFATCKRAHPSGTFRPTELCEDSVDGKTCDLLTFKPVEIPGSCEWCTPIFVKLTKACAELHNLRNTWPDETVEDEMAAPEMEAEEASIGLARNRITESLANEGGRSANRTSETEPDNGHKLFNNRVTAVETLANLMKGETQKIRGEYHRILLYRRLCRYILEEGIATPPRRDDESSIGSLDPAIPGRVDDSLKRIFKDMEKWKDGVLKGLAELSYEEVKCNIRHCIDRNVIRDPGKK